jgi:hypothetical protein
MVLMTGAAFLRCHSEPAYATPHTHGVRVTIVSLPRKIAARMTIQAAGMAKHWHKSGK